jgi:acyl-CoA dehydrogenase
MVGISPHDGSRPLNLEHLHLPFFSAEHRQFAADYIEWSSVNLAAFEADEGGDGKSARRIFELLGRAGFLERTLPVQSRDGSRLDLRSVCLLREISAYSSAIADVALSEPWLAILPLVIAGSQELRDAYIPRYLSGNLLPAFALSEPNAGSDAAAITTSARRDGAHFVISGTKTWTSNCGLADLYIVFARLEGDGAITAFAVDGDTPGIKLEERLAVMPPHTVGTWSLSDCRVSTDRLIGEPGQGFKIAMTALELFRPTVGAATLGFARRAMDEAVRRSVNRTTFKKPIAEHQLVQAKLADMAVGIEASTLLVYKAAWQHDDHAGPITQAAAIAKLFSTEASFQIIDQAVQIFGGLGMVKGMTVERLFRHARAFRIFDGTSEIQKLIIARYILNRINAE